MLTKAQKRITRNAFKTLGWFDRMMDCLCNDPMTEAMGAPVGDFAEDWSRKYRGMLCEFLRDPLLPQQMRDCILVELERWMP